MKNYLHKSNPTSTAVSSDSRSGWITSSVSLTAYLSIYLSQLVSIYLLFKFISLSLSLSHTHTHSLSLSLTLSLTLSLYGHTHIHSYIRIYICIDLYQLCDNNIKQFFQAFFYGQPYIYILPNPSTRAGCVTRSVCKWN